MSGGHFDYKQHSVREIAEDIKRLIATNGKKAVADLSGNKHPISIIYESEAGRRRAGKSPN